VSWGCAVAGVLRNMLRNMPASSASAKAVNRALRPGKLVVLVSVVIIKIHSRKSFMEYYLLCPRHATALPVHNAASDCGAFFCHSGKTSSLKFYQLLLVLSARFSSQLFYLAPQQFVFLHFSVEE